jgi:GntR family phosphonate transport system transcriptional regulator
MARSPIWKSIAETLSDEIARGHYAPGDRLPSEADLSARFGVNRHTLRRALAHLAEAGTLHARRGAGVYVTARPQDYALGRRVRFHQNIAASGRTPSRRILLCETRACDAQEAEALGLQPGAGVHVVEGLSLADGQPLATFRSIFPAVRFPELPAHLAATGSITAALAASGLPDYTRASTRITAELASAVQALALRVAEGEPLLRSVGINVDAEGLPVEFGTAWFAGSRVALTVAPEAVTGPQGGLSSPRCESGLSTAARLDFSPS